MRIEPLGDLAYIVRDLDASPAAVARAIGAAKLTGVTDVVPCAETVGVYFQAPIAEAEIEAACVAIGTENFHPKLLTVPVCYELGQDLEAVAAGLGMPPQLLVEAHAAAEYTCFAIGFCPGFAYLGPLPDLLRSIPRLASPRVRTDVGSLGITGNQTAVYPMVRPGGWPIIGMTPLTLVDEGDDYFPISVGDRVRFQPISALEFETLKGRRL